MHEDQLHSQPTKSECGGVAMYVKKSLDHKVLNHLNADVTQVLNVKILLFVLHTDILTQMLINLLNIWNQLCPNLTKTNLFVLWVILI